MKTTIYELLEQENIPKEDTIYFLAKDEVNDFPMTAGNFFRMQSADKWRGESWIGNLFQRKLEEKEEDLTFQKLLMMVEEIKDWIHGIKAQDPKGYNHMAQLRIDS